MLLIGLSGCSTQRYANGDPVARNRTGGDAVYGTHIASDYGAGKKPQ